MRSYFISFCLLALLLLTACAPDTRVYYSALPASMREPPPGYAQLVLYYPKSIYWITRNASINLGAGARCELKTGTFNIKNVAPQKNTVLKVNECGLLAVSTLTFPTAANARYFIRVIPHDESLTGRIASEDSATTEQSFTHGGNFGLDVVDEPTARAEMESLRLCKECR